MANKASLDLITGTPMTIDLNLASAPQTLDLFFICASCTNFSCHLLATAGSTISSGCANCMLLKWWHLQLIELLMLLLLLQGLLSSHILAC